MPIFEDRECAFQPIIGRLIDSAANLPLARIHPSGKFAVALFTFTPFLSSSGILEAFTCDRGIPRLKRTGNVLIQPLTALSY